MPAKINAVGQKFNRLSVICESKLRVDGRVMWDCICDCGNKKTVAGKHLRSGEVKSCGCLHVERAMRHVISNTKPIGHKRLTKKGYVVIKTHEGFVREHVLVMENHIGRKLSRNEVVHHIDRVKTNNDISNLMLMTHGEHTALHNTEDLKPKYIKEF